MIADKEPITRIDDHVPTLEEIDEKLQNIPQEEKNKYLKEFREFLETR